MTATAFRRPRDRGLLVLDFGSQYTLLIARRLREEGFYTEIIDGHANQPPAGYSLAGIILSGGPDSVTEDESRKLPAWVLKSEVPILGICYGMQLLVENLGGRVRAGKSREYGKATIHLATPKADRWGAFCEDIPTSSTVWMSHGDDVAALPKNWRDLALTTDGVIAAAASLERPIIALQFHPEVRHTEYGAKILNRFARQLCHLSPDWNGGSMVESALSLIRNTVDQGHVLMAVSGGVDSTVAAALMVKALGPKKVTTVFVDHGLLRKNEAVHVMANLSAGGLKDVHLLQRQRAFLEALAGVSDPEQKRKIIGRRFIEEFESFAHSHDGEFTHLGQGTLYPDVIESAGSGSGAKVIKSHHNVGGLPDKLKLKLAEPFRYLFKDEVRQIGRELGLPASLVDRHPFPGPGLAVRILGEVTPEKIKLLQDVDDIYIKRLRETNLYHEAWQAFAVLLPVKSVGVMGDNRTYQSTIALRAVTASDGMTAGVTHLPMDFLTDVASRIVRQVPGVNRVVYDITTKPPATIEWE